MKRSTLSLVLLACLIVALLIVTAFALVSSASAQIGNTGVPMICESPSLSSGTSARMSCVGADGSYFGPGDTTVPAGHYLFVTDYLVHNGTSAGLYFAEVCSMQGTTPWRCVPTDGNPDYPPSKHFTMPMLWAKSGEYLEAHNGGSPASMTIRVYGLLTTSVNYLPLLSR